MKLSGMEEILAATANRFIDHEMKFFWSSKFESNIGDTVLFFMTIQQLTDDCRTFYEVLANVFSVGT